MRVLRLVLIMLMSVAIPLNGFAAAPVSPCPMQMADQNDSATFDTASVEMDCCKDMDTPSSQGKCKPGQSCSLGGVFFALAVAFQLFPPASGMALAHYLSPYLSEQTASIWHPPQLS